MVKGKQVIRRSTRRFQGKLGSGRVCPPSPTPACAAPRQTNKQRFCVSHSSKGNTVLHKQFWPQIRPRYRHLDLSVCKQLDHTFPLLPVHTVCSAITGISTTQKSGQVVGSSCTIQTVQYEAPSSLLVCGRQAVSDIKVSRPCRVRRYIVGCSRPSTSIASEPTVSPTILMSHGPKHGSGQRRKQFDSLRVAEQSSQSHFAFKM